MEFTLILHWTVLVDINFISIISTLYRSFPINRIVLRTWLYRQTWFEVKSVAVKITLLVYIEIKLQNPSASRNAAKRAIHKRSTYIRTDVCHNNWRQLQVDLTSIQNLHSYLGGRTVGDGFSAYKSPFYWGSGFECTTSKNWIFITCLSRVFGHGMMRSQRFHS